jgi:hypothetical protein
MSGGNEFGNDGGADESRRSGNKDAHRKTLQLKTKVDYRRVSFRGEVVTF